MEEEEELLCSLSNTTKSTGSTWLDRLRASKGFPLHHPDLDLDHFLNHHSYANPNAVLPSPPPSNIAIPIDKKTTMSEKKGRKKQGKEGWFDLVSSALADLFRMGDPGECGRKIRSFEDRKISRKQLNPKICVPSALARESGVCSVPYAENSAAGAKKRRGERVKPGRNRGTCMGQSTDPALVPHSRTEVTVIDTSCSPSWKSQKIIYRKGTVWKIRDKKSLSLPRKKRKLGAVEGLVGGQESEQKQAKLNEVDWNERPAPLNGEDAHCKEAFKEAKSNQNSIRERRLHRSRPSHQPAVKGALVFHSQNSAGKKSGPSCAAP